MEYINYDVVVRTARRAALDELISYLESHPKYISRREAESKYKLQLKIWEMGNVLTPIRSPDIKHDMFSLHDIVQCYKIWKDGAEQIMWANRKRKINHGE